MFLLLSADNVHGKGNGKKNNGGGNNGNNGNNGKNNGKGNNGNSANANGNSNNNGGSSNGNGDNVPDSNKPAKPPKDEEDQVRKGPEQIGSHYPILISSDDLQSDILPIVSSDGRRNTYSLTHKGASYIALHFANMDLKPSCSLEITDAEGEQFTLMRGRGRADQGTFWARHVKGESVVIILQCNGQKHETDFVIDEYVAGYSKDPGEKPKEQDRFLRSSRQEEEEDLSSFLSAMSTARHLSICGADDKRNAVCFKNSHPTEYDRARAVARIFIKGSGACTGWLVGSENILITNQHCINTIQDLLNSDFEFMGEEATCSSTSGNCWMCDRGTIFDGSQLLFANANLDLAIIKLAGNPLQNYGYVVQEDDLQMRVCTLTQFRLPSS